MAERPAVRSVDPVLSYQFAIEVSEEPLTQAGFAIPIKGYFSEVSGLDVEWETVEYKTTTAMGWPYSNFVPLRPTYRPITLRRGITSNEGFWLWHQLLALGAKPLLTAYVLITMFDRSYQPMVQWSVERAWPSRISGPQIRADTSDIGIEELTLTHSGVVRMYLTQEMRRLDSDLQGRLPS
jgi:phage tail-like protein